MFIVASALCQSDVLLVSALQGLEHLGTTCLVRESP